MVTFGTFSTFYACFIALLVKIWFKCDRANRMASALDRELLEVAKEIKEKLEWVSRDVSKHLDEVDPERTVVSEGIHLYLGEREKFVVLRPYWKAEYVKIAESIDNKDFSDFYVMYRLVDSFEKKFHEMKLTFETSIGNKDVMALACFKDLKKISNGLQENMDNRLNQRRSFWTQIRACAGSGYVRFIC